jgi:hypothetical protein
MTVLPGKKKAFLRFCELHTGVWAASGPSIGLSAGQVAEWTALYESARDKQAEAQALRQSAMAATLMADAAVAECRAAAASLVRRIKVHAGASEGPLSVYGEAEIPAPAQASTVPPPGEPTSLRAGLNPDGSVTLRWKSRNPRGTSNTTYLVRRRVGAAGPMVVVGTAGSNRVLIDRTVPAGEPLVQYDVRGIRGLMQGPESAA